MNWILQAYTTDTGAYFVTRRGSGDWIVLDSSATIYDGFIDENSAMAFAESLDAANTLFSDQSPGLPGQPPSANPATVTLSP